MILGHIASYDMKSWFYFHMFNKILVFELSLNTDSVKC